MLRRCAAALLALVIVGLTVPARGAGQPFVFRDPPVQRSFMETGRYGLMGAGGEAVVPAIYSDGYPLLGDDGSVKFFAFHSRTILRGGQPIREGSALYGADGALLAEGVYENYSLLSDKYIAASRVEGEGYTLDILDAAGAPVEEGVADIALATGEGTFLLCSYRADEGWDIDVRDAGLNPLASLTVAEFSPYVYYDSPPALYAFKKDGASGYGFFNPRGEVVIEPQFAYALHFTPAGTALAQDASGKRTLVDEKGEAVMPFEYDDVEAANGFIVGYRETTPVLLDEQGKALTEEGEYVYFQTSPWGEEALFAIGVREGGLCDVIARDGSPLLEGVEVIEGHSYGETVLTAENRRLKAIVNLATGEEFPIEGTYAYRDGDRVVADTRSGAALYDLRGNLLFEAESIAQTGGDGLIIGEKRYGVLMSGLIDRDGGRLLPTEFLSISPLYGTTHYAVHRGSEMGYVDAAGGWLYRTNAYARLVD